MSTKNENPSGDAAQDRYDLDAQIGFVLRRAHQRHVSLFSEHMPDGLTPQQFAVLARLSQVGRLSQNELGRQAAMDQSTINGVVQRLIKRGLVERHPSPLDRRMLLLDLTEAGRSTVAEVTEAAHRISAETLAPLTRPQQENLLRLLRKIC